MEALETFGKELPSLEQWRELKDCCSWKWTGKGYKVTGNNGKSIFLPAAGCRWNSGKVQNIGISGHYWSSTIEGDDPPIEVYYLDFHKEERTTLRNGIGFSTFCSAGKRGHSVRLVYNP